MSATERFDAVVIGAGQGGVPLATALAAAGMRTAIIEKRHVGGTCVNYGCTPTKTMVASARIAHLVARGGDYGVRSGKGRASVDLPVVRQRKRDIVASFRGGSERRISSAENLSYLHGRATLRSANELDVELDSGQERLLEAKRLFINTGARPALPKLPGLSDIPYLDNESIMELDTAPGHLIVIGGGYIGVEFAQMFRRFGSAVTIVQRQTKLLPHEDEEVSDAVAALLEAEGIELVLAGEPLSVEPTNSEGTAGIRLEVRKGGTSLTVTGSHLLLAAGRTPNTDDLGVERAGVELDERGYIRVNERLETTSDGIWALGDVKGGPAFTHISYDDYRIIVRNLLDKGGATTEDRFVPYCVFTDPPLGRVGLTEREASRAGHRTLVASMPMTWVARALETDETVGLMKTVVDADSHRILGFAMLGIDAGEIAGAVQIAMMGGLPYTALRDGTFAHPTTLESLNNLFGSLS